MSLQVPEITLLNISKIVRRQKDVKKFPIYFIVRHVEFFSHDDPHMYHGSPYEVKRLNNN